MAIAFDLQTTATDAATTALTWSHTCASSLQRILFVGVDQFDGDLVTGVTYNGVALTLIDKVQIPATTEYTSLYYLIAPATGANNAVVSASGNSFLRAYALSYTGVAQVAPIDASVAPTNTGTTLTFTVTTTTSDCWMVGVERNQSGDITAGANTVVRQTVNGDGSGCFDSDGARAAGSNSLIVTTAGAQPWAGVAAAFKPALVPSMLTVF